jgi:hypothetical protein
MMLATTSNSTSTYFGLGHMCHKHNKLFTMEHVQECSEIRGCDNIQSYARRLKEQHILEWSSEERLQAITEFALLTIQMKNLESTNQASLVQTQPPAQYIKKKKGPGRPRKKDQVAETCAKLT